MFEQLLHFSSGSENMGIICSVQSGQYLALQTDKQGQLVRKADHAFASLSQAKNWLKKQGIKSISLRQTPAYFEMIGLPQ